MRVCPTCGHCHPSGLGSLWCGCSDCWLIWSGIPREYMDQEHRERLDELMATR